MYAIGYYRYAQEGYYQSSQPSRALHIIFTSSISNVEKPDN